ncbi:MAG: hypothetical protein EBT51_12785 [Flavobacteriaceae bacterium]|nr:hypothetical protein [Flavobacteriaceae bacterium]
MQSVRLAFLASLINIVTSARITRGARQIFSLFFQKIFLRWPLDLAVIGDYMYSMKRNNGGLQMRDFEMFSGAGNAAVGGIVDQAVDAFDNRDDAWDWAANELELLAATSTYGEADDTAVREAVWEALIAAFPTPMFKSVRV